MSWLTIIQYKIVPKSKNGACCHENNMGLEVEATSYSKDKGEKNVFQMESFYDRLHLSLQSQMAFIGLDFEADEPRMNA